MFHTVLSADMSTLEEIAKHAATIAAAEDTIRTATTARDALIVQAREGGHPWHAIAAAAGLERQSTATAARRANGGTLPKPQPRN